MVGAVEMAAKSVVDSPSEGSGSDERQEGGSDSVRAAEGAVAIGGACETCDQRCRS